jgi:hypothetical protein
VCVGARADTDYDVCGINNMCFCVCDRGLLCVKMNDWVIYKKRTIY